MNGEEERVEEVIVYILNSCQCLDLLHVDIAAI